MTEEARKLMGNQSTPLALNVLYCIVSLVLLYVYDGGNPQVDVRSIQATRPQLVLVRYLIPTIFIDT